MARLLLLALVASSALALSALGQENQPGSKLPHALADQAPGKNQENHARRLLQDDSTCGTSTCGESGTEACPPCCDAITADNECQEDGNGCRWVYDYPGEGVTGTCIPSTCRCRDDHACTTSDSDVPWCYIDSIENPGHTCTVFDEGTGNGAWSTQPCAASTGGDTEATYEDDTGATDAGGAGATYEGDTGATDAGGAGATYEGDTGATDAGGAGATYEGDTGATDAGGAGATYEGDTGATDAGGAGATYEGDTGATDAGGAGAQSAGAATTEEEGESFIDKLSGLVSSAKVDCMLPGGVDSAGAEKSCVEAGCTYTNGTHEDSFFNGTFLDRSATCTTDCNFDAAENLLESCQAMSPYCKHTPTKKAFCIPKTPGPERDAKEFEFSLVGNTTRRCPDDYTFVSKVVESCSIDCAQLTGQGQEKHEKCEAAGCDFDAESGTCSPKQDDIFDKVADAINDYTNSDITADTAEKWMKALLAIVSAVTISFVVVYAGMQFSSKKEKRTVDEEFKCVLSKLFDVECATDKISFFTRGQDRRSEGSTGSISAGNSAEAYQMLQVLSTTSGNTVTTMLVAGLQASNYTGAMPTMVTTVVTSVDGSTGSSGSDSNTTMIAVAIVVAAALVLVAVLVVGALVYMYKLNKNEAPVQAAPSAPPMMGNVGVQMNPMHADGPQKTPTAYNA